MNDMQKKSQVDTICFIILSFINKYQDKILAIPNDQCVNYTYFNKYKYFVVLFIRQTQVLLL